MSFLIIIVILIIVTIIIIIISSDVFLNCLCLSPQVLLFVLSTLHPTVGGRDE